MNSLSFLFANGVIDVAGVIGVAMLLVQLTKGVVIDSWMSPAKPIHDNFVELYTLLVSLGLVLLVLWGSGQKNTPETIVTALIGTIVAVASEFGIYGKLRGPVPQTPTVKYIQATTTLPPAPGQKSTIG